MSTQKFSIVERYAIWKVHGEVCFYDGEPVRFVDMEVDHLVPESLLSLPTQERIQALGNLGLPANYDILGYANLVPSCGHCNGRKSARRLRPQFIALSLAITEPFAKKIETTVKANVAVKTLDAILRQVAIQLAIGTFDHDSLLQGLEQIGVSITSLSGSASHLNLGEQFVDQIDNVGLPPGLILASMNAAADIITVDGVTNLLTRIAKGEVSGERVEGIDGACSYVIRSGSLYVRYALKNEHILILSCHLT